jgi:hypothetical protein
MIVLWHENHVTTHDNCVSGAVMWPHGDDARHNIVFVLFIRSGFVEMHMTRESKLANVNRDNPRLRINNLSLYKAGNVNGDALQIKNTSLYSTTRTVTLLAKWMTDNLHVHDESSRCACVDWLQRAFTNYQRFTGP